MARRSRPERTNEATGGSEEGLGRDRNAGRRVTSRFRTKPKPVRVVWQHGWPGPEQTVDKVAGEEGSRNDFDLRELLFAV